MKDNSKIKTILFIGSNPKDTDRLDIKNEFSTIIEKFEEHKNSSIFKRGFIQAASYNDLQQGLLDHKPHIVHFSGHGHENGLLFEDDKGYAQTAGVDQIINLFELVKDLNVPLECVLVNACDSHNIAMKGSQIIPHVIGMNSPIKDKDAIRFAEGFYTGIVRNHSYYHAFLLGVNSIMSNIKLSELRSLVQEPPTIQRPERANKVPVLYPLSLFNNEPLNQEKIAILEDELKDINTSISRRLRIGNELRILGDTRPGVNIDSQGIPDIEWIKIPAGEYQLQTGDFFETEGFYISKYLVTNQQYNAFEESPDFKNEALWEGLKFISSPENEWNLENQPKSGISFFESVAFTRWLTQKLELEIRLPIMEEWEISTKGNHDWEYPWGNDFTPDHANCDDDAEHGSPGRPTFVGMYPAGVSEFGVYDMSGNVWEWCLNMEEDTTDTHVNDSESRRVIRGGSFLRSPENAKISYINSSEPSDISDYYIGIRIVTTQEPVKGNS